MKIYINIAIILSIVLAFISCDSNKTGDLSETENFSTVETGMLHVDSYSELDSIVNIVSQFSDEEQVAWEESKGYSSYQTLYNSLFDEYEAITNSFESEEELIQNLDYFMEINGDNLIRPQLVDDSVPDYSIEPIIKGKYARLANQDGYIEIGKNILDAKIEIHSKSTGYFEETCEKTKNKKRCKHDRKMEVEVHGYNDKYNTFFCTNKKKVCCIWVGYKTEVCCEYKVNPTSDWEAAPCKTKCSNVDIRIGQDVSSLRVWNQGVTSSRKCEFNR